LIAGLNFFKQQKQRKKRECVFGEEKTRFIRQHRRGSLHRRGLCEFLYSWSRLSVMKVLLPHHWKAE